MTNPLHTEHDRSLYGSISAWAEAEAVRIAKIDAERNAEERERRSPGALGKVPRGRPHAGEAWALSRDDEKDLADYFSQTAFERSAFGMMFERALTYRQMQNPDAPDDPTKALPIHFGRGRDQINPFDATENKRAQVRPAGGYIPDDGAMLLNSTVSIRLRRMERASAQGRVYVVALALFYGTVGDRWALPPSSNRYLALQPLTEAGRKILRVQSPTAASDDERLANEAASAAKKAPRESKATLSGRAQSEAIALYREACIAWNAAMGDGKR